MKDLLSKAVAAASPSAVAAMVNGIQQCQSAFQVGQSGGVTMTEAMENFPLTPGGPRSISPGLMWNIQAAKGPDRPCGKRKGFWRG